MSEKRKKCRKERVGSVAANPDNLESNKEAGGEHKVLNVVYQISDSENYDVPAIIIICSLG